MKVLHLVIHVHQGAYRDMYHVLSGFYKRFETVDTYFVCTDPGLATDFEFDGNVLRIRGQESAVPGILQKTLDGLLRFDLSRYDYVVRSNSSTVIDFFELFKFEQAFKQEGVDYLAAHRFQLAWLDPANGIHNTKYFGLNYAAGTSIVLSQKAALELCNKRHFLDYTVVDDVAIGVFFRDVCPTKLYALETHKYAMNVQNAPLDQRKAQIEQLMQNQPVAWRNKSAQRQDDALAMQYICTLLSTQHLIQMQGE